MPDTLKLKRATKSIANQSTKVLEKDEILAVTPDSGSGKGKYQLRFGDGVTPAKDLPISIDGENVDDMKVSAFTTPSDENPVLTPGDTVSDIAGKQAALNTKIGYERLDALATALGAVDQKDFVSLVSLLNDLKFNKSDVYSGLDSTNDKMAASSNALRQVNEKSDSNTQEISKLSRDLDALIKTESRTIAMPATQPGHMIAKSIPYTPPAGYTVAGVFVYTFSGCISDGYCSESGYLSGTLYNPTDATRTVEIVFKILLLRAV